MDICLSAKGSSTERPAYGVSLDRGLWCCLYTVFLMSVFSFQRGGSRHPSDFPFSVILWPPTSAGQLGEKWPRPPGGSCPTLPHAGTQAPAGCWPGLHPGSASRAAVAAGRSRVTPCAAGSECLASVHGLRSSQPCPHPRLDKRTALRRVPPWRLLSPGLLSHIFLSGDVCRRPVCRDSLIEHILFGEVSREGLRGGVRLLC